MGKTWIFDLWPWIKLFAEVGSKGIFDISFVMVYLTSIPIFSSMRILAKLNTYFDWTRSRGCFLGSRTKLGWHSFKVSSANVAPTKSPVTTWIKNPWLFQQISQNYAMEELSEIVKNLELENEEDCTDYEYINVFKVRGCEKRKMT
mgnify:CR=1 FL=1